MLFGKEAANKYFYLFPNSVSYVNLGGLVLWIAINALPIDCLVCCV